MSERSASPSSVSWPLRRLAACEAQAEQIERGEPLPGMTLGESIAHLTALAVAGDDRTDDERRRALALVLRLASLSSGSRELAARTGTARVHASVEGGARYGFAVEPLKDRTVVDLGHVKLTVLHTPGHTPEHVSFLATEKSAPGKPWALFTGDCLFVDSVGRPDLLGTSQTMPLARKLFHTLHHAYKDLADPIRIYPAHGAGSPCGANIAERDSTLGMEREHNPMLKIKDEARFIQTLLFSQPPVPYYWPRMKKVNAAGPEVLHKLPGVDWYSPRGFWTLVKKGEVQLIDNRQMLAFGGGHVAGALNVGPRPELSIWAGWLLDPAKPIHLVLEKDGDLAEVVRQFVRVGFTRFGGYLPGGMEEWSNKGLPLASLPQMTVRELDRAKSGGLQILDVRTPAEWEGGHVPGARYVFLPELEKKLDKLDRDRPVAVYCDSGYRASIGASILQRHGFARVRNVPGSWKAWKAAGYAADKPKEHKKASDTDRS